MENAHLFITKAAFGIQLTSDLLAIDGASAYRDESVVATGEWEEIDVGLNRVNEALDALNKQLLELIEEWREKESGE